MSEITFLRFAAFLQRTAFDAGTIVERERIARLIEEKYVYLIGGVQSKFLATAIRKGCAEEEK